MEDEVKCQVCGLKLPSLYKFKEHVRAVGHQQRVAEVFQKDIHRGPVYFPTILVPKKLSQCLSKFPLIGLNVMTLCLSSGSKDLFYLCHSCEETCSEGMLTKHLVSPSHYSNYYGYTDPDQLNFAWFSDNTMENHLLPLALEEVKRKGPGQICVFDMPGEVFNSCKGRAYPKVMQCLTQTDLMAERITADRPKQVSLQEYKEDPNRKKPLLGLQHIVEYFCKVPCRKSAFLCTLCARSLPANKIIKHIIGFDHIYWYLKEWHPSTLLIKDNYKTYNSRFASRILNIASQAEAIRGMDNAEIKQVELEPALFTSVGFSCYKSAFERLESIRKGHKESSLKIIPKPGEKLTEKTLVAVAVQAEAVPAVDVPSTPSGRAEVNAESHAHVGCLDAKPNANSTSKAKANVIANAKANCQATTAKACDVKSSQTSTTKLQITNPKPQAVKTWNQNIFLCCVDCRITCRSMEQYKLHMWSQQHMQVLTGIFGQEETCNFKGVVPYLNMYHCFRQLKYTSSIGVDWMVVYITRDKCEKPMIVCNVCQELVPDSKISSHLVCQKHLLQALKLQCPDRLPFGWEESMPVASLKPLADMEEQALKPIMIKIFELPANIFRFLRTGSYSEVYNHFRQLAKYLKDDMLLQDRPLGERKHPLLGLQFMVQYNVNRKVPGYLCLLCERKLLFEGYSHMFSIEHVTAFLERAHPGTLKDMESESRKRPDVLLDLAKQAQKIHPTGWVQNLKKFTVSNSNQYTEAFNILNGLVNYNIMPVLQEGSKLVPSDVVLGDSPIPRAKDKDKMTGAVQETINQTDTNTLQAEQATCKDLVSEKADQNGMDDRKGTRGGMERETVKETGGGMERETVKETGGGMERETVKETEGGTERETVKETRGGMKRETVKETGGMKRETVKETEGGTERETVKETGGMKRETVKETEGGTERETVKETGGGMKRESVKETGGTERETVKETERGMKRETVKETEGGTERKTVKETGGGMKRETVKETGKQSTAAVAEPKKDMGSDREQVRKREHDEDSVETTEKSSSTAQKNTSCKETERWPRNKNVNLAKKRTLAERVVRPEEEDTAKLCGSKMEGGEGRGKKRKMVALSETQVTEKVGPCPPSVLPPPVCPIYHLWNYLKIPQREPVIGLSHVIECHAEGHAPFYVCETCKQTVSLTEIITHLTSAHHQQAYLQSLNRNVLHDEYMFQRLRVAAQQLECEMGSGVAQVVELEDFLDDHTQMDYNQVIDIVQEALSLCSGDKEEEVDPTQTSTDLWSYLTNSDRRQPVIGLRTVTEIRSPDQPGQNHFYCDSCSTKFDKDSYISHLVSARHRYNYIKREHPRLICDWPDSVEPTSKIRSLCELARRLEDKEGWGRLKVKTQPAVQSSTISTSDEETIRISQALWKFLERPNRQPVIGLSMLTEYHFANKTRSFLCCCCSAWMQISACTSHIVSTLHRYNYIKQMHPELAPSWPKDLVLTKSLHEELRKMAVEIEKREGCGKIKVVKSRCQSFGDLDSQPGCSLAEPSQITDTSTTDSPDTAANPDSLDTAAKPDSLVTVKSGLEAKVKTGFEAEVKLGLEAKVKSVLEVKVKSGLEAEVKSGSEVSVKSCLVVAANPDTSARSAYSAADSPDYADPEPQPVFSDAVAVSTSTVLKTNHSSPRQSLKTHSSVSRKSTQQLKSLRKSSPVVGMNFLVAASYRKKTCFFCQLCAVRMGDSTDHMTAFSHQHNYLRLKYPGWTAHPKDFEKKLAKMASYLAKVDRDAGLVMQKVRVNGAQFKQLMSAPEQEALRTLEALIRSRERSGKTLDLRQTAPLTNPDRAHSDQGPIPEASSSSGVCGSERKNENGLLVEIPVCDASSKILVNDQEPLPCSLLPSPLPVSPTVRVVAPTPLPSDSLCTSNTLPSVPPTASALTPPCVTLAHSSPQPDLGHSDPSSATPVPWDLLESPQSPEWWERSEEWPLPECTSSERPPEQDHDWTHTPSLYGHLLNSTACRVPLVHLLPDTVTGKIIAGPSNLSKYLVVKGLHNKEPIIGLDSVLECRGISQDTFFICVSCAVTLPSRHICEHIVTVGHQYCYIRLQYPDFLASVEKNCQLPLLPDIVRFIALKLTPLEAKLDAQVIRLDKVWYERVKSAPFSQALDLLKIHHEEPSPRSFLLPAELGRLLSWEANPQSNPEEPQVESHTAGRTNQEPSEPAQDPPRSNQKLAREETVLQSATIHNLQKTHGELPLPHSPVDNLFKAPVPIKQELEVPAQPGVKSLPEYQDFLYADRVQFSPDVQDLTSTEPSVCEVEWEETFSGYNLTGKRPSGATENPLRASKDIRDYIKSRRAEAVVGLCAVIECLSEGQVPFYLCVSCKSRLNRDLLINHVLKYRHRQIYLNLRYPWHLKGLLAGKDPAEQSVLLMQVAKEVEEENHDEPGTLQNIYLDPEDFKEIRLMVFEKAVSRLQEICKQKNQTQLLTCVTEKPEPVVVKQEVIESPVIAHHEVRQTGRKRCSENSEVTALEIKRQKRSKTESAVTASVPETTHCIDPITFPRPVHRESTSRSSHSPLNSSHKPTKTDVQIKPHTNVSNRESESDIVPFTDLHPNPRDIATYFSMDKRPPEQVEKSSTAPETNPDTGLSGNDPCNTGFDSSPRTRYKLPLNWLKKHSPADTIKDKCYQIPNPMDQHHSHSDMAVDSQNNALEHSTSSPTLLQYKQAIEPLLKSSELPSHSISKTSGHPFGHNSNPTTPMTINASQTTHLQDLPLGREAASNLARSVSCPDPTTVSTSDGHLKQYSKEDCQKFVDFVLSLRKNGIIPQATSSASPNSHLETGSSESKIQNRKLEPQPGSSLGTEMINQDTMGQRIHTQLKRPTITENMSAHPAQVDLFNYEDREFHPIPKPSLGNNQPCYYQPSVSYADASYYGTDSFGPLIADHNPPTHPQLRVTQPMEGHLVSNDPGLPSPMGVFHGGHYSVAVYPQQGYPEWGSNETERGSTGGFVGNFYSPLSAPVAPELRDIATIRTGLQSDPAAYSGMFQKRH